MENNNNNTVDKVTDAINESVENGVLFAALAYVPFLWLLGLLISPAKDSAFVKGHVNNGIIATIVAVIAGVLGAVFSFIPVLGGILGTVIGLVFLAIAIMGIYKAIKKEAFLLPVIGDSIKIVK